MRGIVALTAEIFDALDDARSEIHLPETIDGDAAEKRIGWIDDPFGKAEAVVRRVGRQRIEHRGNAWLDEIAGLIIGSANEQVRGTALGHVLHDHDGGEGALELFLL